MFETVSADVLLRQIEDSVRGESMVIAGRMSAVAGLLWHRTAEAEDASSDDPGYALITGFARASAEVSAAMNMAPMAANRVVAHAEALHTRLPQVATLLAEGTTDWPTVAVIITRTAQVDGALMAELDRSIAERIGQWSCWSRRRVINAVDAEVRRIDPEAAKERRVAADNDRHVSVIPQPNGMARLHGALSAPAAAVFDKRLSEMATSVCRQDSRTIAQRRADALLALSEGRALSCDCGRAECPARNTEPQPAPPRFVMNVIAPWETLEGRSDEPGYLEGYGVIDADQLRQLAETAVLRLLSEPAVTEDEALRYQPSAALQRWIRCRDLMCCFPGCDRPAWRADIDHTEPYNHADPRSGGLTVSGNAKCYCRTHHRLKTFLSGPGGWRDVQLPDGTVVLTSPTGRVYHCTRPGLTCSPRWVPRAPNPYRENAADAARRRPAPRPRDAHSPPCDRPISNNGASTAPAATRSNDADGATTSAKHSPPSKAANPAPAHTAAGSTTHQKTNTSPPTGYHHPHPHQRSTTNHPSERGSR